METSNVTITTTYAPKQTADGGRVDFFQSSRSRFALERVVIFTNITR